MQKVGDLHDPQRRSAFEGNEILILAATSAILLYVLWQFKDYQVLPSWDGTYYINYSIRSVFPPGYPFFIMVFNLFVSPSVLAARAVSMFFLCATVVIVYVLGKRYVSAGYAFIAALFAGFAPLSLRMGVDTLSETTYAFFIVLAAYLYSGANPANNAAMNA